MTPQIGAENTRPRFPHLHPEYLGKQDERETAQAQAADDYVESWLDGSLYDDGEVYTAPLQALIAEDGEMLGDLLRAYRSKDPQWFDHLAGRVARALEKHVRGEA